MFAALQRFRIYTAYCSANVPRLQARFAGMMDDLATRMQRVSTGLLASGAFSDLKDSPVPPEIVFAFQDMYEDMEHNFERRDPETSCPLALESLRTQDDDSLKSELESALVAVRNMMRNVEKASAP